MQLNTPVATTTSNNLRNGKMGDPYSLNARTDKNNARTDKNNVTNRSVQHSLRSVEIFTNEDGKIQLKLIGQKKL